MTEPNGGRPQRPGAVTRWGPLVGILVVIAVVVAVVVVGGRDRGNQTAAGAGAGGAPTGPPASSAASKVPITYAEAQAAGTVAQTTWVDNCDPATGKIRMPSVYAPPCVPKFTGANGGATATGVTGDEITVVVYQAAANGDLAALLQGLTDSPEDTRETTERYGEMAAALYQTYGRKVKIVQYQATGAWNDQVAARADAIKVADEIKPFASFGGPILAPAYAEELANRGILCVGCGQALPDSFAQQHQPYIWGPQASPEQFLTNVGDYVVKRLLNRPAAFAGGDVKGKPRKFGVVHFEQDPPVFTELGEQVRTDGALRGFDPAATESYIFDLGKMPERATTVIAKMKDAGVTSIVFLGDPLMPIYLTKAATAQNYYPEWIITGTALTDVSVTGRLVDQEQYRHAYGLSGLAARIPQAEGDPYRLHEWYFGTAPKASKTSALIWSPIQFFMTGVHMAGPELTPETFAAGLFKVPPAGGGPTTPQLSFGDHGLFKMADRTTPRVDYFGFDDMTEIWWDPDTEAPDEQGKVAKGVWRYANGGKRYLPGQMPDRDPDAFKVEGSVVMFDRPPPEDQPPSYPPPPQAPAAR